MLIINKIVKLAEVKKIPKARLYESAEVERKTFANWEDGIGEMRISHLEKISKYLNVSPAYWWEEEKEKTHLPDGGKTNKNSNHLNEPEMNYGETILREDHLREVYQLNREINRLEKMLEQATGINFNSKTAG